MASRVVYGLGKKGFLPRKLSQINRKTRTPLIATFLITLAMLSGALFVPLDALVTATSQIILGVFALVNLALVVVKIRGDTVPEGVFTVPLILPIFGVFTCLLLLLAPLYFS